MLTLASHREQLVFAIDALDYGSAGSMPLTILVNVLLSKGMQEASVHALRI